MKILQQPITKAELLTSAEYVMEGGMVKADVDLGRNLMIVDAGLHADMEKVLLDDGSKQEDLWGINLYLTAEDDEELIEYDSMINIRPRQGNRSRTVQDPQIREQIAKVVHQWLR